MCGLDSSVFSRFEITCHLHIASLPKEDCRGRTPGPKSNLEVSSSPLAKQRKGEGLSISVRYWACKGLMMKSTLGRNVNTVQVSPFR